MKYSLEGIDTIHGLKQYVLKAMNEMKLGSFEIHEFQMQINKYDFAYAYQVAQDYIEELNRLADCLTK